MSLARPVSKATLASIPWMSAKSLSQSMREVSLRGPNDADTWRELLSRADVIVESFDSKQSALVLNSLARVRRTDRSIETRLFLKRFASKFLIHVLDGCNALDVAHLVHGLSQFTDILNVEPLIEKLGLKIIETARSMSEGELCMTAVGLGRLGYDDRAVQALLDRGDELCETLNGQTLAQLIHLASLHGNDGFKIENILAKATQQVVEQRMNAQSAVLVLNSIARSGSGAYASCSFIQVFADNYLLDPKKLSLRQEVVTLRSLQKLGFSNLSVIYSLIDSIANKFPQEELEVKFLCILLNAVSRLVSASNLLEPVLTALTLLPNNHLTSAQITVVIQSLARCSSALSSHANKVDQITKKIEEFHFTGQELSIVTLSLARMRRIDMHMFELLSKRCRELKERNAISPTDIRSIQVTLDSL